MRSIDTANLHKRNSSIRVNRWEWSCMTSGWKLIKCWQIKREKYCCLLEKDVISRLSKDYFSYCYRESTLLYPTLVRLYRLRDLRLMKSLKETQRTKISSDHNNVWLGDKEVFLQWNGTMTQVDWVESFSTDCNEVIPRQIRVKENDSKKANKTESKNVRTASSARNF